jgi:hypothetical protein
MTLKEKFKQWFINDEEDEHYEGMVELVSIEHEKIAEDFAIGFAEWCDNNYFRMGNTSFWSESMDWDNDNKFTTKELLEIYKKEKGL